MCVCFLRVGLALPLRGCAGWLAVVGLGRRQLAASPCRAFAARAGSRRRLAGLGCWQVSRIVAPLLLGLAHAASAGFGRWQLFVPGWLCCLSRLASLLLWLLLYEGTFGLCLLFGLIHLGRTLKKST